MQISVHTYLHNTRIMVWEFSLPKKAVGNLPHPARCMESSMVSKCWSKSSFLPAEIRRVLWLGFLGWGDSRNRILKTSGFVQIFQHLWDLQVRREEEVLQDRGKAGRAPLARWVGVRPAVLTLELAPRRPWEWGEGCMGLGKVWSHDFLLSFLQGARSPRAMAGTDLVSSQRNRANQQLDSFISLQEGCLLNCTPGMNRW